MLKSVDKRDRERERKDEIEGRVWEFSMRDCWTLKEFEIQYSEPGEGKNFYKRTVWTRINRTDTQNPVGLHVYELRTAVLQESSGLIVFHDELNTGFEVR